ncbi:polygalacturonase-like [Hevea brasiliensis]|uniref:polygalacturonase-like n=1 Tax=Hevea brasiliensis TaxID=3981 RepID=UPI0025F89C68|nr:polygalacturonase-like [Hevea brasiliensis]
MADKRVQINNPKGSSLSDPPQEISISTIRTGDDCISIGQGVTNATISEIFCGPGHGLSIGSLGKYEDEADVKGIMPSPVKISNVHYKNIGGTSTSKVAVNFLCSSSVPCEGIELTNIDLSYVGTKDPESPISASCTNAKVKTRGAHPPGCEEL